ncbi:hypothetical protein ACWF95_12255 [Streptomyces vinaceus]
MARPTDWSALGFSEDPTPGDPDEIDRVIASQYALIELASTIEGGLDEVLNTASNAFKGKTADAIRGKIDGRIRGFVTSFKKAHESVRTTLQTYSGVMREQQRKTHEALTAAQALKEDDTDGREAHKKTAQSAKEALETAAATAATAISDATESISSPVDDCAEIWKILTYIAIILIIPAIFTGGTLALVAFGLNLALMIKTAVDFGKGDASVTDLILSIIGVIAPTTKGLNVGQAWGALKGFTSKGIAGFKGLVFGGPNSFGQFIRIGSGLGDVVSGTFTWVRAGVFTGLKFDARGIQGGHFLGGGGRAMGFIPVGVDLAVINIAGATTFFGVRSIISGLNGIKSGVVAIAGGLSGWKGLRLIMPVAADEMGQGIGLAIRIGFYDRGLLGMYRYGAFVNGKFIGDLGKVSGAAGAGSHFFGEGGAGGGLGLIHTGGFSFSPGGNPFGAGGTGAWHGFTSPALFNGPPPGLSAIVPQNLDIHLGAAGGLGAIGHVDLPPIDARLVDLSSLGAGGTFHLPTLGPVTPVGINGGAVNLPGLGSIPASMPVHTQVDIPQLGTSVGALPSTTVNTPELTGITGALVPVNVSMPAMPSAGHVSVPALGTVGGGEIGTIRSELPAVDAQLVDLPSVQGLGQLGNVQLGQVHLPSMNTSAPAFGGAHSGLGVGEISVPQTGAHLGEISVPNANAHLGGMSVPQARLGEIGVPGANTGGLGHVDMPLTGFGQGLAPGALPSLGQVNTPVAHTGAVSLSSLGVNGPEAAHVPPAAEHIGSGELAGPHVNARMVDVPALLPDGGPAPGSLLADLIASVHAAAGRSVRVNMAHDMVYDLQHTFTNLPGLPGVEVRVAPGMQSGAQVDIEVEAPRGLSGTIDARHVRVADLDVLRIEHLRPDGTVHRLDYALDANAGHGLVDDQVIDVNVTGTGPAGSALELQPLGGGGSSAANLPDVSSARNIAEILQLAGLGHIAPGTVAAGVGAAVPPPPPVVHVAALPGLDGAHAHIQTDANGVITDVRGGPGGPPVTVTHLPGAGTAGVDIVRVEHTAVPGVEVLRWEFTADRAGHTLVGSEQRFHLGDGTLGGTTVSLHLNPDRSVAGIRHLGAGGNVLGTGGRPVLLNGAGLNIPAANGSGFHLYDPATGLQTHSGTALTGPDGLPNGLHVLTPQGVPAGAAAAGPLPAPQLTAADGLTGLGTVTRHGDLFHVSPAPAPGAVPAPHLGVYRADGSFAHNALPVPAVTLPGGAGQAFVRLPDAPGGLPRLVHADGGAIDGAGVHAQGAHGADGFRIDHGGQHLTVDPAGVHTHDVVTLHGPHVPAGGHFVLTPVATPHTPVPRLYDAHGVVDPGAGRVARVDGTLHVDLGQHRFSVHTLDGAFSHEALAVQGLAHVPPGSAFVRDTPAGGAPELVRGNGTAIAGATVTGQGPGGFRIEHAGQHIAVGPAGAPTHHVITLHGTGVPAGGQYVFTPVATPDVPAPHPRDAGGGIDAAVSVQRVGSEFLLTDAHATVRAFDADTGAVVRTDVPVSGGSALDGHIIRTDAAGTVTVLRPDHLRLPDATAYVQTGMPGGGFRVSDGSGQFVVDAHGARTHTALELRDIAGNGTGHHVFQPAGAAGAAPAPHPAPKDAVGADVPGTHLTVRPDGALQTTGPDGIRLYRADDGAFQLGAHPLSAAGTPLPEHVGLFAGGGLRSLDPNLLPVDGTTVTARPGGGFRVEGAGGEFRLFNGAGVLEAHVTPVPGPGNALTVTPAHGAPYRVVPLGDAVGRADPGTSRFVDTSAGAIRLLDGNLGAVGGVTLTQRPGGGYRLDGFGGLRAGEYKLYAPDGTLEVQRINVVHEGRIKADQHLELHHVALPGPGTAPANTWELVRTGPAAPALAGGTSKWFEGGLIDPKALAQGRVLLTTHSGTTAFDQRPLPNGNTLGAFQSSASADISGFSLSNQRGVWNEIDPAGQIVRFGTRHWGESFRTWFDTTDAAGVKRVLHFQQLPDGGHVLGSGTGNAVTQSLGSGTWVRYGADFKMIAEGTRAWGPVRGFTDKMIHPLTGESVLMHEKFGRFQFNTHDVRRLFQREVGADGVPKVTSVSLSAPGKEIDSIKALENGEFLIVKRMAEQRPPTWYRYLLSSEYRSTDLSGLPWLKNDSLTQLHEWNVRAHPDSPDISSHGIRLLTQNGAFTDIAHDGRIVRETRKLFHGNDLTVGNVKLPDAPGGGGPVPAPAGYVPWSEGAGNLHGHRTFDPADFDAPTGIDMTRITWQDRFTTDLNDGDWFTPNPGKQWEVVRTGLSDGTVVEYRPQPAVRPDGAAGNGGAAYRQDFHMYNGDWTRYDHHGYVVSRSDTWPSVGGDGDLIINAHGPTTGKMSWSTSDDPTIQGPRLTAHARDVNRYGWDRESYQDFTADMRLIRDHQLLADGTTVDAWRVSRDAEGNEVWHWRKVDQHGNIKQFGAGPGDQVRRWIDAEGTVLPGWAKNARWSDHVLGAGNLKVQEIPAKPDAGFVQNLLGDKPFRIREFVADPGGTFHPHVWKEFDTGAVVREKKQLTNGTFLETETWQQHWRQYGASGTNVIAERAPSGFVYQSDAFGRLGMVGRETDFVDWANQYRGYYRMLKDPNRWEFGPAVGGESTYRPFLVKAGQQLGVEMGHEFFIDLVMNAVVLLMGMAATGLKLTGTELAKVFYNAAFSAAMKGAVIAGHQAYGRGTPWKNGLSHIDYGFPYQRHPSDDNWRGEWAGHDKVTRWRGGVYDFGVGVASGAVGGFAGGAVSAALFGVKNSAGELLFLRGAQAAAAGLMSATGGTIGGLTLGAARTLIHLNLAGRWWHRAGVVDIFIVPALGKLIDKSFATFFMGAVVREWFKPGWYLVEFPGVGEGPAPAALLIDTDFIPQGAVTP